MKRVQIRPLQVLVGRYACASCPYEAAFCESSRGGSYGNGPVIGLQLGGES
jgi:hypothetical protein